MEAQYANPSIYSPGFAKRRSYVEARRSAYYKSNSGRRLEILSILDATLGDEIMDDLQASIRSRQSTSSASTTSHEKKQQLQDDDDETTNATSQQDLPDHDWTLITAADDDDEEEDTTSTDTKDKENSSQLAALNNDSNNNKKKRKKKKKKKKRKLVKKKKGKKKRKKKRKGDAEEEEQIISADDDLLLVVEHDDDEVSLPDLKPLSDNSLFSQDSSQEEGEDHNNDECIVNEDDVVFESIESNDSFDEEDDTFDDDDDIMYIVDDIEHQEQQHEVVEEEEEEEFYWSVEENDEILYESCDDIEYTIDLFGESEEDLHEEEDDDGESEYEEVTCHTRDLLDDLLSQEDNDEDSYVIEITLGDDELTLDGDDENSELTFSNSQHLSYNFDNGQEEEEGFMTPRQSLKPTLDRSSFMTPRQSLLDGTTTTLDRSSFMTPRQSLLEEDGFMTPRQSLLEESPSINGGGFILEVGAIADRDRISFMTDRTNTSFMSARQSLLEGFQFVIPELEDTDGDEEMSVDDSSSSSSTTTTIVEEEIIVMEEDDEHDDKTKENLATFERLFRYNDETISVDYSIVEEIILTDDEEEGDDHDHFDEQSSQIWTTTFESSIVPEHEQNVLDSSEVWADAHDDHEFMIMEEDASTDSSSIFVLEEEEEEDYLDSSEVWATAHEPTMLERQDSFRSAVDVWASAHETMPMMMLERQASLRSVAEFGEEDEEEEEPLDSWKTAHQASERMMMMERQTSLRSVAEFGEEDEEEEEDEPLESWKTAHSSEVWTTAHDRGTMMERQASLRSVAEFGEEDEDEPLESWKTAHQVVFEQVDVSERSSIEEFGGDESSSEATSCENDEPQQQQHQESNGEWEDHYDSDDSMMAVEYKEDSRFKFLVPQIPFVLQKWEQDNRKAQLDVINQQVEEDGFCKELEAPEVAPRTPRSVLMAVLSQGDLQFKLRKVPEEHKKEYQSIAQMASSLGRLTKLPEHIVESKAAIMVPDQEPSSPLPEKNKEVFTPRKSPLSATRSSGVRLSMEAAALGKMMRLQEEYFTNWDEDEVEEDLQGEETSRSSISNNNTRSSFAKNMDFFESKRSIDDARDHRGFLLHRTSLLIHHHVRDSRIAKMENGWSMEDFLFEDEENNDLLLDDEEEEATSTTSTSLPKFQLPKPEKQLSRDQIIESLAQGVAEKWWERRYRLERPGAELRVRHTGCHCAYCNKMPSPRICYYNE